MYQKYANLALYLLYLDIIIKNNKELSSFIRITF